MKKILIVNANYYNDVTSQLVSAAKKILKKDKCKVSILYAPGVFEIPISIKKNIKRFDAFIALGCVIKGKTPHFDFISKASTDAIMKLSIDSKKPIGNGIITCLNMAQARARRKKGAEAAEAVISVLSQK